MPVALLPPRTSSPGHPGANPVEPLTTCERYIRGARQSRWHRVRSGYTFTDQARTIYMLWCGPSAHGGHKQGLVLLVDDVPDSEPVCGTCVGRALGAGQDDTPDGMPKLRFDPRWSKAPAVCPGSNKQALVAPLDGRLRVGRCLACGVVDTIRAAGRGYASYGYGLVKHQPGPGLVDPCPFHAWQFLTARSDTAACSCGWVAE